MLIPSEYRLVLITYIYWTSDCCVLVQLVECVWWCWGLVDSGSEIAPLTPGSRPLSAQTQLWHDIVYVMDNMMSIFVLVRPRKLCFYYYHSAQKIIKYLPFTILNKTTIVFNMFYKLVKSKLFRVKWVFKQHNLLMPQKCQVKQIWAIFTHLKLFIFLLNH